MRVDPRGVLLVAFIAACTSAPPTSPASAPPSPSAPAEPSPSVAVNPSTPPPSGTPIPTSLAVAQLDGLVRSLTTSWRPSGEVALLQVPGGIDGSVILAAPLDGSPQVPLLAFGGSEGWDARRDGSAVAISLLTGPSSARIAVWEGATGRARWVSPPEAGVLHRSPVWSADGTSVYYSAIAPPDDRGIFRVSADGGPAARIRAPEGAGAGLIGLTPDGRGLVWARIQEGGSTEVLDVASGRNTSFDPTVASSAASWRASRPRALVLTGTCCAGRPTGTLNVWDDVGATVRPIFGTALSPNDGVRDAAWSPAGTRIVAIVHDLALPSSEVAVPLVTMNEQGAERESIPGTAGAVQVEWTASGIVYQTATGDSLGSELMLVPAAGGAPVRLHGGSYVIWWRIVAR